MALGMRTAWVLLVLNTVDWVMALVYTNGVYISSLQNDYVSFSLGFPMIVRAIAN